MDGHLMQAARRWTPSALVVGLFIAAIAVVFLVGTRAPQPHGHWTDHLTNATIDASMLVIVLVGVALTWRRLGQRPVILFAAAALAIVVIGLMVEVVGNMRVAHVIWQTPYTDDSVDAYASGLPGYRSGHTLEGIGDLLVLVGGVAFATVLGVSRRVGPGAAVGGAALAIIPPPFIIPAFGVTFLLAWLLRPMSRRRKQSGRSTTPTKQEGGDTAPSRRGLLGPLSEALGQQSPKGELPRIPQGACQRGRWSP
jgi:hypothetical protein